MVRNSNLKRILIIGVNLLIFFFLVKWVADNVNLKLLLKSIQVIPLWAGLLTIVINLFCLILYSLRMSIFLGCPFRASFSVISLGFGFNSLFPFRLGEGAKVYYINKIYSIPVTSLIRSFFFANFLDLTVIFFLGLIASFFKQELIESETIYLVGGIAIVILALFGAFSKIFRKIQINAKLYSRLERKHMFIIKIARIFENTMSKSDLLFTIVFTILVWILNIITVYIAFNTYTDSLSLTFFNAVVLLVIIALSIAVPSAPAGLGIYEAGIVAYLIHSFHIGYEPALAVAFYFHLMVTIPSIVFTCVILVNNKIISKKRKVKGLET